MRKGNLVWPAIAVMGLMTGCETSTQTTPSGAVLVKADGSSLSADDIAAVQVTIGGEGISPDITADLTLSSDDGWSGNIDNIPAGTDRTFTANAYDADGALVYTGDATGITIEDGVTTTLTLFLQQASPPESFGNAAPTITSLSVWPMIIAPGEDVSLCVDAFDADPNDHLVYDWTATAGAFSSPSAPCVVWSSPETTGSIAITVSVADTRGAAAELNITIQIENPSGSAEVDIVVNTSPEVQGLVPSAARIDAGESIQLSLDASDPEGDPLSFEWRADCDGTFNDINSEDPYFTLSTVTGDTCTLTVIVNDGNNGSNQAEITIQTGPEIVPTQVYPGCEGVIEFSDTNLEAVVRSAIDKPTGDIYFDDVVALTSLTLQDTFVSDLSGIECLVNLTALSTVDQYYLEDLSALSGLIHLTHLSIVNSHVRNTSAISGLTNLTHLVLEGASLNDISSLSGLTNLTVLNLNENGSLSDISVLSGLPNLTALYLAHTNVSDISVLSSLTNLNTLYLASPNISDISVLSGLTNLTTLYIGSPNIGDLSALSTLTNLTSLYLYYITLSGPSVLSSLTNLTRLYIGSSDLSDLSSLSGLSNLTSLTLVRDNLGDISALSGLTNLSILYLNDNSISDISALSGLTNLTTLSLHDNDISDLSALSGLTNLVDLALYQNNISDISALSGLTGLSTLSLGNNGISDLSALSGLINLVDLSLYQNSISDISALSGLSDLTSLSLSNNSINVISALSGLSSLRYLYLQNNTISDLYPLVENTGLGEGDTVYLRGNLIDCGDPTTQDNIAALEARFVTLYHDCG